MKLRTLDRVYIKGAIFLGDSMHPHDEWLLYFSQEMSGEETGGGERRGPGLRAGLSKQDEVEDVDPEEDTSPSSEASDATIVPNTSKSRK